MRHHVHKIITSWNALALKGYTDAYAALQEEAYLSKALTNARFIEKNMLGNDSQLWRSFSAGKVSIPGFLDDYAFVARAFIRLYQVTFDKHWLLTAQRLAQYAVDNFYDVKSGMFYYTSAKSEKLVVRKIELSDNALPSSNSVMAEVLYELGLYFENGEYEAKANGMIKRISGQISSGADYYTGWCYLTGILSHGTREVVIMGKDAKQLNLDLQQNYLPNCLIMGETKEENLPLMQNKMTRDKTLIYICINKTCKLPVVDVRSALGQLQKAGMITRSAL